MISTSIRNPIDATNKNTVATISVSNPWNTMNNFNILLKKIYSSHTLNSPKIMHVKAKMHTHIKNVMTIVWKYSSQPKSME